jgi:hypothetical protein
MKITNITKFAYYDSYKFESDNYAIIFDLIIDTNKICIYRTDTHETGLVYYGKDKNIDWSINSFVPIECKNMIQKIVKLQSFS